VRRAIFILAATMVGLVWLLSFKTTPLQAPPGLPLAGAAPATTEARSRSSQRSITGPPVLTRFGPVQVKLRLVGNHISDVQALQLPSDFALSQQLSAYAEPQLRQETLQAQNAHIDVVSGATYTSKGYQQSLQAALDRANG